MKGRLLLAVSTAFAAMPSMAAEICGPEVINGLLAAGADPVLVYRSCKLDSARGAAPITDPSPMGLPAATKPKVVAAIPVATTAYAPKPVAYAQHEKLAQGNTGVPGDNGDSSGSEGGAADTKQTDPLSKFSMSARNGSTLATIHVATAFAPIGLSPRKDTTVKPCTPELQEKVRAKMRQGAPRDTQSLGVGVDLSSSFPMNDPTREDYGRHALTKLDGGILNLYLSMVAHNTSDCTFSALNSADGANPRVKAWDHFYFLKTATPDTMLPYVKHALGIRAVKTSLEKSETDTDASKDSGAYGGLATYYLGLGVDGPLLTSSSTARDPNAGWFGVEAFGAVNLVNSRTLNSLFKTESAPRHFNTIGARATIGLPGRFFISAEYGKALGSYGKAHIGDTSMILFGYNNQSAPDAKTQ